MGRDEKRSKVGSFVQFTELGEAHVIPEEGRSEFNRLRSGRTVCGE
jgi:hypothetical protein